MKKCPKCGYMRQERDDQSTPEYECPRCGIVYSKVATSDSQPGSSTDYEKITTQCSCGGNYSTSNIHKGKTFRCKNCGLTLTIGQQNNDESPELPKNDLPSKQHDEQAVKRRPLKTFQKTTRIGDALLSRIIIFRLSITHFIKAPVKISLLTLIFLVSSILAVSGLITSFLVPVFFIGYLGTMRQILEEREVELGQYIGFLRHGWNSLWHLLMMLGSFIVTISIFIAPAILLVFLFNFALGTATTLFFSENIPEKYRSVDRQEETVAAITFLRSLETSISQSEDYGEFVGYLNEMETTINEMEEADQREQLRKLKEYREERKRKITTSASDEKEMLSKLKSFQRDNVTDELNKTRDAYQAWEKHEFSQWYYLNEIKSNESDYKGGLIPHVLNMLQGSKQNALLFLLVIFVLIPLCAAIILNYYLCYEVSIAPPTENNQFDLVYKAFMSMLDVVENQWKEIFSSGVIVSVVVGIVFLFSHLISITFRYYELFHLSIWYNYFFTPLASLLLITLFFIFFISNCLDMMERKRID